MISNPQIRLTQTPCEMKQLIRRIIQTAKAIFIDTEIADWMTDNPRLSLLQVRLNDGEIHVADVLCPGMQETIDKDFIPAVMESPTIVKWAHNAPFEKRFLGKERVRNLNCTLQLARDLPYYRLPLRSLSLRSLVKHFCQEEIDKDFQKADWSIRPLPESHLQYAAMDPHWCFVIHEHLETLVRESLCDRPTTPVQINGLYESTIVALTHANRQIESMRCFIKTHMLTHGLSLFSDFGLQASLRTTIGLATLCRFANTKDPSQVLDFSIPLSRKLLNQLSEGTLESLRQFGKVRETSHTTLRGPAPRPVKELPTCTFALDDPQAIATEYKRLDHDGRVLESHKSELRTCMRNYLNECGLNSWGKWLVNNPVSRRYVDVRSLADYIPLGGNPQVNPPHTLQTLLSSEDLASASEVSVINEIPVLVWRYGRNENPGDLRECSVDHEVE